MKSHSDYVKDWISRNKDRQRGYNRKRRGIKNCPPELPIGAPCQLCGKPYMRKKRGSNTPPEPATLYADHDHTTGEFRGWLCGRRNVGIGMSGENVDVLKAWIAYLETKRA